MDPATTEIYTLSLHDALPICGDARDDADTRGVHARALRRGPRLGRIEWRDRKSTRLNSSHLGISYAVFCLKKKKRSQNNAHGSVARVDDRNVSHDATTSTVTR